jgi:hypothetical protein
MAAASMARTIAIIASPALCGTAAARREASQRRGPELLPVLSSYPDFSVPTSQSRELSLERFGQQALVVHSARVPEPDDAS